MNVKVLMGGIDSFESKYTYLLPHIKLKMVEVLKKSVGALFLQMTVFLGNDIFVAMELFGNVFLVSVGNDIIVDMVELLINESDPYFGYNLVEIAIFRGDKKRKACAYSYELSSVSSLSVIMISRA